MILLFILGAFIIMDVFIIILNYRFAMHIHGNQRELSENSTKTKLSD